MKKINILKENKDYTRIIKKYKPFKYRDYIIYVERNTNDLYKFGFSVGTKVGNAVTRNKIKRRLKNILDKKSYQNNFNCIIIVKKGILDKTFTEMEKDLLYIVETLKLTKGAKNEK